MQVQFHIAGVNFRPKPTRDLIESLPVGAELALVPEPDNPYDMDAIALYYRNTHCGYVPRTLTSDVHYALSENREFARVVSNDNGKPLLQVD